MGERGARAKDSAIGLGLEVGREILRADHNILRMVRGGSSDLEQRCAYPLMKNSECARCNGSVAIFSRR